MAKEQADIEAKVQEKGEDALSPKERAKRDKAASGIQAVYRGGKAREEVKAKKAERDAEVAAAEKKKKKLKKKKTAKKESPPTEPEAKANQENKSIDFNVILDQPLGMKIDIGQASSGADSFPAMVTEVVAGGQAEAAGIELNMHVVAMNGESTKGKTLDDVVQLVIQAKTEQTPLVMSLKTL